MQRYLNREAIVTDLDLAYALLQSAVSDRGVGALGSRLRRLRVKPTRALQELIAETTQVSGESSSQPFLDPELSASMVQVRASLGSATLVTASRIAAALQVGHKHYGGGTFGSVKLRPDTGERRTTDEWLIAVRELYDMDAVVASRHKVLHGALVVVALAELDRTLAADLTRDGVIDRIRQDLDVLPRHNGSDRTEWTPDSPATEDLLGRADLARALAERVRRLAFEGTDPRESFLVHIDGPWGSGKSSLFYFLEKELERERPLEGQGGPGGSFLIVPVNAWREQRVGVQWWTLLSALQRAIARDATNLGRVKVWVQALYDRFRARWVPFVVAALVLLGVAAGVLAGLNLDAGAEFADSALKVTSLASVLFAGLVAAARYLLPGSKRSAESLIENSENPVRQVGRLFARSLRRASKPVVFLIDDLDRCDADYVVEFLEVVQTLVRGAPAFLEEDSTLAKRRWGVALMRWLGHGSPSRTAGPYGFIAADGRWIRASYEQHFGAFGGTSTPGRPLGYLFLEKVFQLHVLLPVVTDTARKSYFGALLTTRRSDPADDADQRQVVAAADKAISRARNEEELLSAGRMVQQIDDPRKRVELLGKTAVRFSERAIEDAPSHELAEFVTLLDPNPRSMKLFVNTYGVLRSLRALEEVFVGTAPLALWTVIEIRWPELADYLRARPETVDDWDAKKPLSPEAKRLLGDPDVETVLRDPGWDALNGELIRLCAGAG